MMVAPTSLQELLNLKKVTEMADTRALAVEAKRRELLAANKEAARLLLVSISLGTSSVSYVSGASKNK